MWVAVRRSVAHLALADGVTEADLYDGELDEADRARFSLHLETLGLGRRTTSTCPSTPGGGTTSSR